MNEKKSIGRLISIINRTFSVYFNSQLKNPSIGIGQVRLIKYIKEHNGCCQRDINDHFMMDKGTTTSLLLNLERNGFIKRERNTTDSRLKNISLTEAGKDFEAQVTIIMQGWTSQLLNGFTDEEKEAAYQLLNKMVDNISYMKEVKIETKEWAVKKSI